ncbi:MAG: carboxylating nicotinate-nucleotide diphosphorylase [Candidatus Sumerlaeia bacterium]|nr:carboxylating nicotinate-nucleotide diphosphorylase [Candidatus Sumerlaeia bacterium]
MGFPDSPSLRARIRMALAEDLGEAGDVTSNAVFPAERQATAEIVAKQTGVVAGLELVRLVFAELDGAVDVALEAKEGDSVQPGRRVARLSGPARSLFAGERLALNFLQRLSGIATLTHTFVQAAGGRLAVCDTRKTTPLWRDLEKYAVAVGGGTNHRFGLHDMVMLKDTHADGAEGLHRALERVRALRPGLQVAAEARTLDEVRAALDEKVDLLMLDNMDTETLRAAIALARGRAPIEITGGIRCEHLADLAELGIDRVSVGALTHSAPAMDYSMRIATA